MLSIIVFLTVGAVAVTADSKTPVTVPITPALLDILGEEATTLPEKCPPYLTGQLGYQAFALNRVVAWATADAYCHRCGGRLPEPRSQTDIEVLAHFVDKNLDLIPIAKPDIIDPEIVQPSFWLGITYQQGKNVYVSDGKIVPEGILPPAFIDPFEGACLDILLDDSFFGTNFTTYLNCNGAGLEGIVSDSIYTLVCEKDREEDSLYIGTQLEFCLITIEVCKEVLPLCYLPGLDNTYCCRSRPFYSALLSPGR